MVTGATGYTGRHIARRLLAAGRRVRSLTNHPDRSHAFGDRVTMHAYDFDRSDRLTETLRGADTLYNTYWVRFAYGSTTYEQAVENTRTLLRTARAAGVRKVVHISIANPDAASPYPYYRGKAVLEQAVQASGLQYAIFRPTVIFGDQGILLNNIAWCLRHFPVFAVPGDGRYGIQPIAVDDLAALCVKAAGESQDLVADAVGPEVFGFRDLVEAIRRAVGSRAVVMNLPPSLTLTSARMVGRLVGDQLLTREELDGLMAGLLVSQGPPTGWTRLSDWLAAHRETLGRQYLSEVGLHFTRTS